MPDDLSFSIDTRALDEALAKLPTRVQKRILRPALEAAGDEILTRMKARVPSKWPERTPKTTALPIGIVCEDLHTDVRIGETTGANVRIGPTEIAGHVVRWLNNGFHATGRKRADNTRRKRKGQEEIGRPIPGLHFVEGAADEGAQAALDILADKIAEGLETVNE